MMLRQLGWNAGPEVRLKVVDEAEPIPDIVAIHGKAPPGHQKNPPELCVEILSSGKELKHALWKAHHYLDWGTSFVWIVDPEARIAWRLTRIQNETVEEWIRPDAALTASSDTSISLPVLFEEVDKQIEQ